MLLPFWLLAALMIATALALVLRPLLGERPATPDTRRRNVVEVYGAQRAELDRDLAAGELERDSYQEACNELGRRLLEDVGEEPPPMPAATTTQLLAAVSIALLLPVLAFGVYFQIGNPGALASTVSQPQDPRIPHSVEEMVEGLRQRLAAQPGDADGWVMLGRFYARLNRLEEARFALDQAVSLQPTHVLGLVAYAEVLAGLSNNRLAGEPLALIERALQTDPTFARALWLAGVAYHNAGDSRRAVATWQQLQALGLEPAAAEQVARAIARAGGSGTTPAPPVLPVSITVTVQLSPALADRVQAQDTVFVFARALDGPRIPLAIARLRAGDLPASVTLDDSLAMTPQLRISGFPEVTVTARVSRSGNATPDSGDLEGSAGNVQVLAGARAEVVIASIVP